MTAELTAEDRANITQAGEQAGMNAASWVFDGNTSQETFEAFLTMSADGDPALYDTYDAGSPLSGEWSDGPTVRTLVEDFTDLGVFFDDVLSDEDNEILSAVEDEVASLYESAYGDAFYMELERVSSLNVERHENAESQAWNLVRF